MNRYAVLVVSARQIRLSVVTRVRESEREIRRVAHVCAVAFDLTLSLARKLQCDPPGRRRRRRD
jgi:hypothetical protein